MNLQPFRELMAELLTSYGIEQPAPHEPSQEVYLLHFSDQPPVYLICRSDSKRIDVLIEAGWLSLPPSADQLLSILDISTESLYQAGTISVHRPSRTVVVWTSVPRDGAGAEGLRSAVASVRAHAELVRQRLARPAESRPAASAKLHSPAARLRSMMR